MGPAEFDRGATYADLAKESRLDYIMLHNAPGESRSCAQHVTRAIEDLDEIEIFDEPAVLRQEVLKILSEIVREEEGIEAEVRRKIQSQRRIIPEGSPEWDILYRKYYGELIKRFGVG